MVRAGASVPALLLAPTLLVARATVRNLGANFVIRIQTRILVQRPGEDARKTKRRREKEGEIPAAFSPHSMIRQRLASVEKETRRFHSIPLRA